MSSDQELSRHGQAWADAPTEALNFLDQFMISIVAFDNRGRPQLIGTAFVVGRMGSSGVAFSAAHNFDSGVRAAQFPNPTFHPTTPPEFRMQQKLELSGSRVAGIYSFQGNVFIFPVNMVAFDGVSDIAVLTMAPQRENEPWPIESTMELHPAIPSVGDKICLAGYAEMSISAIEDSLDPVQAFKAKRRTVLRRGTVTQLFLEGHYLARGPCFETTIPVYPGMSGGPAFLLPKQHGEPIRPIGIISSDPEEDDKSNNKKPGSSIVSILQYKINSIDENTSRIQFEFSGGEFVKSAALLSPQVCHGEK